MNDKRIEGYLNKSTRGLWGRKRHEVKEELSTHIEGRVNAHLIAGLRETDAVEKALTELGQPKVVSIGMARLYTLPVVAGSGIAFSTFCLLTIALLTASTAQTLNTIHSFPSKECLNIETELPWYCPSNIWISIENLKSALEPQGITFTSKTNVWIATLPDQAKVNLLAIPQVWSIYEDNDEFVTLNTEPGYIQLREVIKSFSKLKSLPVSLEGWEKPLLKIGNATIEINFPQSNSQIHYNSSGFYSEPISMDLFNDIPTKYYSTFATSRDITTGVKTLSINANEGTVYGLVTIMDPSKVSFLSDDKNIDNTTVMYWDVTQVDSNRKLNFRVPLNHEVTFLPNTYISDIGRSILVRLSGDLSDAPHGYVVIPPDEIVLE